MKQSFVIEGGNPLHGSVEVPTAKNSVLPLLAASLLCQQPVTLHRVPRLSDVDTAMAILNGVGAQAKRTQGDVTVCPGALQSCQLPAYLTEKMRASVLFLAPMLSRFGRVETGMSGGCRIGARPIDIHLDGLVKMGARVCWGTDCLTLQAPHGLMGVDYTLRYPSVGATETLLMAAVRAKGITILRGAAQEPEIVDLARFLNACGAKVAGAGSGVICVLGVRELQGATFTPLPDRIVAATFACAAAAAGGEVNITHCTPSDLQPVLEALRRAGCTIEQKENAVLVARAGVISGIGHLATGVYPAFPTDAAPLLAAALLGANSETYLEDRVFEHRFACAAGFSAMGANVAVQHSALAIGVAKQMQGAQVFAPDLRGGAALVIAALAAQGTSEIGSVRYILRGYENVVEKLLQLGGTISEKND